MKTFKVKKFEYFLHYFNDNINAKEYNTWGATSIISIILSTMLHSKKPEFDFQPGFSADWSVDRFLQETKRWQERRILEVADIRANMNDRKK